jgi:hypothetical protein
MRYLRIFFAILTAVLVSLAGFNAAIDPFGVLGAPVRTGLNDVKYLGNDRFVKPLQILRLKPDIVYFGSSRVLDGLNPEDIPERNIYNFGIPAATIAEMDVYARHVMAVTPAKLLVFGLDYVSFDDGAPPRPGFDPNMAGPLALWSALPRLLFSAQTTLKGRSVIKNSRKHAAQGYHPNGFFDISGGGADPGSALYYAQVVGRKGSTQQSLARFDSLLTEAQRRGIKVMVFLPPLHAGLNEALALRGLDHGYEVWLRQLVALCDAHAVPLWDFDGFNRETTVRMADSAGTYLNGGHLSPNLGRLVQQILLRGQTVSGFGERLTSAGLDDFLLRQQAARALWHDTQPDDLASIHHAVLEAP